MIWTQPTYTTLLFGGLNIVKKRSNTGEKSTNTASFINRGNKGLTITYGDYYIRANNAKGKHAKQIRQLVKKMTAVQTQQIKQREKNGELWLIEEQQALKAAKGKKAKIIARRNLQAAKVQTALNDLALYITTSAKNPLRKSEKTISQPYHGTLLTIPIR